MSRLRLPNYDGSNSDLKDQYSYYGHAHTLPVDDDRLPEMRKQREERGFDTSELWSLDCTIASFILPRLKVFHNAYVEDPDSQKDMQLMIQAFELLATGVDYSYDGEQYATVQKGLQLFARYLPGLWT